MCWEMLRLTTLVFRLVCILVCMVSNVFLVGLLFEAVL